MITIRYNRDWQDFQVIDPQGHISHHYDDVWSAWHTAKFLQEKYHEEIHVSSSARSKVNKFLKENNDA